MKRLSAKCLLVRELSPWVLVFCTFSVSALSTEPEDSPLYATSRQQAFAEMADRDRGVWPAGSAVDPAAIPAGGVIVVEGTRWRALSSAKPVARAVALAAGGRTSGKRPQPMDVTTDLSCSIATMCTTCQYTSCGPTCDSQLTCWASYTCRGATCFSPSCRGPTCSVPTCVGVSCAFPGPTCSPYPSCGTTACGATCLGTCSPDACATTLSSVEVPRPGEIHMSFIASSALRYTLQTCTNLALGEWTAVNWTSNTQGTVTLSHTNPAPVSCYRLLVQLP